MKKVGVFLGVVALLSLACVAGSFAQDREVPWNLIRGNTFIGADVENPQGQNLGDIKDIVIDRGSGRIAYAVVSFGGFLGMFWYRTCTCIYAVLVSHIQSCLWCSPDAVEVLKSHRVIYDGQSRDRSLSRCGRAWAAPWGKSSPRSIPW